MKNSLLILALFGLLATLPGLAQNAPAKKVKTMVDYKKELNLSDSQVNDITLALKSFQDTVNQQKALLQRYEKDYSNQLKSHAPLPEIKQKLKQLSEVRFQLRYADVVTSRKVEKILSASQMKAWKLIQTKVRAKKR